MCKKIYLLTLLLGMLSNGAFAKKLPAFDSEKPGLAPDYTQEKFWAALPFRQDAADVIPPGETWVSDSLKDVDVFYVYPTLYTKGKHWNADLTDEKLNKRIDEKPVYFQASVFNQSCRVYAPRYRQAIVEVFFKESEDGQKALDFAFNDVKNAFEYYLKHYNNGRPIIIAGHSQGSYHTRRLIKDYFDNSTLKNRLVAAYIIGYQINNKMYEQLSMCQNSTQTGCFVSWMSYKEGVKPKWEMTKTTECINPLTWTSDPNPVPASASKGTVLLNFDKIKPQVTAATIHNSEGSILWVKTKMPVLRLLKNLHIADYNLFWTDIRQNVKDRINAFWKQ